MLPPATIRNAMKGNTATWSRHSHPKRISNPAGSTNRVSIHRTRRIPASARGCRCCHRALAGVTNAGHPLRSPARDTSAVRRVTGCLRAALRRTAGISRSRVGRWPNRHLFFVLSQHNTNRRSCRILQRHSQCFSQIAVRAGIQRRRKTHFQTIFNRAMSGVLKRTTAIGNRRLGIVQFPATRCSDGNRIHPTGQFAGRPSASMPDTCWPVPAISSGPSSFAHTAASRESESAVQSVHRPAATSASPLSAE